MATYDDELKQLIKRDIALNQENHQMLKKLLSALRWGMFFSILKWVIVIGAAAGIYYLFQPLLDQFSSAYEGLIDILPGMGNAE